jgi:hypothetical protein
MWGAHRRLTRFHDRSSVRMNTKFGCCPPTLVIAVDGREVFGVFEAFGVAEGPPHAAATQSSRATPPTADHRRIRATALTGVVAPDAQRRERDRRRTPGIERSGAPAPEQYRAGRRNCQCG